MPDTNGNPTPERIAELERENALLREKFSQVEIENKSLHMLFSLFTLDRLPNHEREFLQSLIGCRPFDDVLAELELDFGPFDRDIEP